MKKTLLVAALLSTVAILPAKAHFVLADETFADLGGTGFGVLPRLLTLQDNGANASGLETGGVTAGGTGFLSPATFSGTNGVNVSGIQCNNQNSCSGLFGGLNVNQSNLVNIALFGWTSGANVGVGLDTNQTGSTDGLMFNNLVLTIFNSSGAIVGQFGSTNPVLITQAQLDQQQGNGNSVFDLRLSLDEQSAFNTMLANNPGNLFAGLAASMGCSGATGSPVACQMVDGSPIGFADDGAESFLGFNTAAVPGPIAGAGIPGLIAAAMGMLGFNRFRRRRTTA